MENNTGRIENPLKDESSLITRRRMFQVTAVGTLVGISALQIVYRRSQTIRSQTPTDITIEGPFNEYGYFKPEDLGREDIKNLRSDFVFNYVYLSEGKYFDTIFISYTFAGKQNTNRKMNVCLSVLGVKNSVISETNVTVSDPRVFAVSEFHNGTLSSTYATLSARLDWDRINTRISCIKTITITAVDLG